MVRKYLRPLPAGSIIWQSMSYDLEVERKYENKTPAPNDKDGCYQNGFTLSTL